MSKPLTHLNKDDAPACGEDEFSERLLTDILAETTCPKCPLTMDLNLQQVSSVSRYYPRAIEATLLLRQWIVEHPDRTIVSFNVTEYRVYIVHSLTRRV